MGAVIGYNHGVQDLLMPYAGTQAFSSNSDVMVRIEMVNFRQPLALRARIEAIRA
jgi:hypothetical protein